ncbi:MAG: hypothetical protein QM479_14535 [Pseudomonadota bacterium]
MYLSQELGAATLNEIAPLFGLKTMGSIPTTIKKLKFILDEDEALLQRINQITAGYYS